MDEQLFVYQTFLENFLSKVNPEDQLPVRVSNSNITRVEVIGAVIDWILQYLDTWKCPKSLVSPLTKIILDEVRPTLDVNKCQYYNEQNGVYASLPLMQHVIRLIRDVCQKCLDQELLASLPVSNSHHISIFAVKNRRRCMEDSHVIINDLQKIFDLKDCGSINYYAIFDGHNGNGAAMYSAAHLHQFLAESQFYPMYPEQALCEAFKATDKHLLEKQDEQVARSGTTAVCVLWHRTDKMLYIAWVGDSEALLASKGRVCPLVEPHKADRKDEKDRIHKMGGIVLFWGMTWRVNGQLAVSRAIGDMEHKNCIISTPDVKSIQLTGDEDFLILACDGLWDAVKPEEAAQTVYNHVMSSPDNYDEVSQLLVQLAKTKGSDDNITVIVVYLSDPHHIKLPGVDMETATAESFSPKQNGSTYCSINNIQSKFDPEDDFGPETNIDNIDDGLLSQPVSTKKSFTNFESLTNNGFDAEPQKTAAPGIKEAAIDVADEKDALSDDSDEDEWNYFGGKGSSNLKPNNFQNSQPSEDNMSGQEVDYALNPDAAEFVPVSPASAKSNEDSDSTSAFAAFAPEVRERLLNDDWVASSPQKGHEKSMENVVVPDLNDFDKEIRKRPSNIMPDCAADESFEIDGDFCPLKTNDTSLECPAANDTCTSTNAVFGDDSSYVKNLNDVSAELPEKTDDGDVISHIKPDHTTDVHDKITENGGVFDSEDYPSIIEREEIEASLNCGFNDVSYDRHSPTKGINFDDISTIIEHDTETTMRNMMTFSEEAPSHSIVYVDGQPTIKVNSRNASPIDDQLLYGNNNKNSNPFAVSSDTEKENAEEKEIDVCQNDGKAEEKDVAQSTQHDFVDFTNEKEVRADVHSPNAFFDFDKKEEPKDILLTEHHGESEIQSTHVDDIAVEPPCSREVKTEVEADPPANAEPESGAEPSDVAAEILSSQMVDSAIIDSDSFDPQDANVTSSSGVVGQTEAPTSQYDAETPYRHDCSRMNEKPDSVHHAPVQTKHYDDLLPDFEQSNAEEPPATQHDAETPYRHDCTRMNEKPDSVHHEPVEAKHYDDLLPDFDTSSTMESNKLESELRESQVKPSHPDASQFSSSFADIADVDPSSSTGDARAADTDVFGLTTGIPSAHDVAGDAESFDHVGLADTSTPSAPPAADLFESKASEQSPAETTVAPAPEAVAALVGSAVAAPLLAAVAVAEVKKDTKKSVIKKPDEKAKPSSTKPPAKTTPPAKPKPATATSKVSAEPRKMSTTMATRTAPVKSSLSAATRPAVAPPKTTAAATRTTAAPTRTTLAAKPASTGVSKPLAAKPSSPAKTRPLSTATAATKPLSNGDVSKPLMTARKIAPSTTAPRKTAAAAAPTDASRPSVNMKTRTSLAPPPRPVASSKTDSAMSDKSKLSTSTVAKRPVSAPSKVANKDSKDLTNKRLSAGKSSPLKTSATTNGKTESKVSSALRSTTTKPSAGSTAAVAVRKSAPAVAVSVNVNQSEVTEHQN